MTKTYFPFDDGAGAEATEASWTKMAKWWRGDGVIINELNALEVYGDSSGMQVKVKTGRAWISGHYFENDAELTIAITAADGSNPRIDRVVLELNWTDNDIDVVMVDGTAGASPAAPALTQSTSVYQIPLAQVWVPAGASTITVNDVLDERVYDSQNLISGGRITLKYGDGLPDGSISATAPTSTDTGAETVTYTTLPEWAVTGQAVTVASTASGLTAGTIYYINVSGTSFTFHTTLRDALGGTNDVNLTGNVTATIYPARLYFVGGNCAPVSVSTMSLTASRPYDAFLYLSNGVPTLALGAWTDATTRATAIVQRGDGLWVKSGTPSYLYVGTVRADASSMVLDNVSDRGIYNAYNQVRKYLYLNEDTGHTYNGALRLWNNSATNNLMTIIIGLPAQTITYGATANLKAGADAQIARIALYKDGAALDGKAYAQNVNGQYITTGITWNFYANLGYSYYNIYEFGDHASSAFANLNFFISYMA